MIVYKNRVLLKIPVLACFIFLFTNVNAQEKNTNEIVAEGSAKTRVQPDIATFTLTVEKKDSVEKNVIENLNSEVDNLVEALNKIGFTNTVIKVADYDVSSSIDDDDKKKYTASNALTLEFGLDTKIINEVYKVIQTAKLDDVDIAFNTKLSDSLERKTRQILVQQAIADAKTNADNIARTLNVKVAGVKQVMKYAPSLLGNNKVELVQLTPPPPIIERMDTQIGYNTSFNKFQVEDVELEEKITVIYEIAKQVK